MKIVAFRPFLKKLALTKPYTIAYNTFSDVELVFLEVILSNGVVGIGSASPAEEVVGETSAQTLKNLQSTYFEQFIGRDIRHFQQLIFETKVQFPHLPGTQAAVDIALHDAFGKAIGCSVVEFYGQKIKSLPTSVTIGIMNVEETLKEAKEFERLGFKVLKVKTGLDVEDDIERIVKLREQFGNSMTLRVDANQGYTIAELLRFQRQTQDLAIELIEQPLPVGKEQELRQLDAAIRAKLTGDESLKTAAYALAYSVEPKPFGIFNIKLMKCGGIFGAKEIANIAQQAAVDLFWGCNDESIISITAALHAAFSCQNTKYIDLDGSFDLAEDIVTGGFQLENGRLSIIPKAGFGFDKIESFS